MAHFHCVTVAQHSCDQVTISTKTRSVGNKMTLTITQGNITYAENDAIVNAANSALREGGGVCGAIFDAVAKLGGHEGHQNLTKACRDHGGCPTGEAAITPSFGLVAKHIIHAVGPIWSGRKGLTNTDALTERELIQVDELASAYRAVIRVAMENGLKSVTIPGISTGIYGFPEEVAAAVAVKICSEESGNLDVHLIAYSPESLQVLQNAPSAKTVAQLNGHRF
jgi:O-acetyl-ADP-ribose deacetylase (regulator of RNase III)